MLLANLNLVYNFHANISKHYKMAFFPSWFREGTYHMRILSPAFRKKKEGQSDLFTYAGSLGTLTQNINMPKWHYFRMQGLLRYKFRSCQFMYILKAMKVEDST